MSLKKRKTMCTEEEEASLTAEAIFHIMNHALRPLISMSELIIENTRLIHQNFSTLEYRIQRMETQIERLSKEIADLHIHALNGTIREDPPYVHY
jgi:hypothetical protein